MILRRSIIPILFGISVGAAAACSGDKFDSGGTPGPDAGGCAAGQALCNGQCVDANNPAFGCGSCTSCLLEQATAKCEAGACVLDICQGGFADCDGQGGCETSLGTAQDCGACGKACNPGEFCDAGSCAAACPPNKQQCGSSCIDTQNDVLHCGACDSPCQAVANALSVCALGECGLACHSGFLNCDGKRETGCEVNSKFDPKHCGACGNACQSGELCNAGTCELSCGGGTTECGGMCVDLKTDEANCGACAKACADGQNCVGGQCKLSCGGGTIECNGMCVDTKVDPNNCGTCGNVCDPGYECEIGVCEPKCAIQTPVAIFFDELADNSKGWLLDAPWAIGPAKASSGHYVGFPDPANDATATTNNGVAGVVLGGNVPTSVHAYAYLTSPVVNAGGATSLFLTYSRWLNSDYEPYMRNAVQVFNGSQWVTIWETGESPGITDDSWVQQSFDITAYKNSILRVRFGYQVGQSGAFTVSGWNVDDVKLTAVTCM